MDTYENKYKELAGKIKKAYLYAQTDSTKVVLENILPELKESKDERIRRELIEHIKANCESEFVLFQKFSPDDVVAWLERQGEKPQVDEFDAELQESEGERIRNGLIGLLKFGLEDGSAIAPGFNETKEQALDWLKSLKQRMKE